jgi:hypothetical protein
MPKIVFKYSSVYDKTFRQFLGDTVKDYPSARKIKNYMENVKKLRVKLEKQTFLLIAKISHLKRKDEQISCYMIGKVRSFSDPLTIRLYKNKNDFIDTLIHELIHQIIIQNREELKEYWKFLRKKFKNDSTVTQNHIVLYAILEELHPLLFKNQKRWKREVKRVSINPDYTKALEILRIEGGEKLKNDLIKRI